MANIKQQKKRIGIAQRQRLENLRYRSASRTLMRSLQDQVNVGDKPAAEATHRELTRLLDRAASRNVLHDNTVARRKSRAWRILISDPVVEAKVVRRAKKKTAARKPKAAKAEAAAPEAAVETVEAPVEDAPAEEKPKAAKKPAAKKPAAKKAEPKVAAADEAPADDTPAEDAPAEDA
jgi:ribosomal protein S20